MISKERLQELIEQGATIYEPDGVWQTVGKIHLEKKCYISEDNRLCNDEITYEDLPSATAMCSIPLEDLFETEEDARWELEMTATRTETLKLPTYEKVFEQDRCLDCYTKEFAITKTDIVMGVCLFGVDFTNKVIDVSVGADKMFTGELTKENYIQACLLAKRLFLGENDDK